jgi:hypothetical protein
LRDHLCASARRVFVNEPRASRIGVIDSESGREIAKWGAKGALANFSMALDPESHRPFAAYRMPALIAAFDTRSGELAAQAGTCRDADDVFIDAKRRRLYVSCGEGAIAVIDAQNLNATGLLRTRSGARTSLFVGDLNRLFVGDLNRLFVAVPATGGAGAELRVYEPR